MPPLTLDGTTGVSAVQTGAVESGDLPAGSVIQVVSTTKTDTFSTTQSESNIAVPGLSVNITPTSASNEILLIGVVMMSSENRYAYWSFYRDGVDIAIGDASGNRTSVTASNSSNQNNTAYEEIAHQVASHFLDSPATTSAVNYEINVGMAYEFLKTIYVNRQPNDGNNFVSNVRGISTLTAMEIAG